MNTKPHETKILYKDLSYIIQGCCFDIRKEYGAGQKESIYVNLLKECLESKGLKIEKEKSIKIYSSKTGKIVGTYRPDLIVSGKIPVEVKSSSFTTKQDEKQLYHYLRNSDYELGYLVNFSTRKLFLKRIIYTNDRKPFLKTFSCIFVFFFVWFSVFVPSAQAAELFFEPKTQEVGVGQEFQVNLMLDPKGEEINTVAAKLSFPEDIIEVVGLWDGSSIITLWVEKPSCKKGTCTFSGIIPGGFIGILGPYEGARPGKVLEIILKAKNPGKGEFVIEDAQVLLHDGLGTPAELELSNFQFSISKEISISEIPILEIEDNDQPEAFEPIVSRDQNIFKGKWFLVFATQDKGSGIDHYEVQENRRQKIESRNWIVAESPYLLKDQELKSYIYVKALDRAGNERIEVIEPRYPLKWYENYLVWIIILLGMVGVYVIRRFLWKKYTKKY